MWSAGAGGGSPERTYAVDRDAAIRSMDAAAQAGVGRYVMVSYFGAGPDHGVPADNGFFAYAEAKAAADAYLRGTGLDWTILGPGALTAGPGNGLIDVDPADTSGGTDTARANVALVAAAVLGLPARSGAPSGSATAACPSRQPWRRCWASPGLSTEPRPIRWSGAA